MKATISYGSVGGYAMDETKKITVTSWNELIVKLGDIVDECRECRYTYRVPSYTVFEDGTVEENDWLYIEDDYIREYFERYRKE